MKQRILKGELFKLNFISPWLTSLVPLLLTLVFDQGAKAIAMHFQTVTVSSFLSFYLLKNAGIIMGALSGLPDVLKIVSLSTAGAFILVSFIFLQFLLSPQPIKFRIGSSLLVGGILGNVIDRMVHGYVIDFFLFGPIAPNKMVFNLADIVQWLGYGLILTSFILDQNQFRWGDSMRNRFLINVRFQLKYCALLAAFVLSQSLILGVYSFTYLSTALSGQPGTSSSFLGSFFVCFFLISLIFCVLISMIGLLLSQRIAGPIHAFSRVMSSLLSGKSVELKLRANDEFKELEAMSKAINEHFASERH